MDATDERVDGPAAAPVGGAVRMFKGALHRHPAMRSGNELTRGERAADRMRNSMGSWAFVFGACGFLALWMAVNVAVSGVEGRTFDPYPFILLNLVLSCVAALQGAILLIAAKRSDQISSELAQHDYEADVASHQLLETLCTNFDALRLQHDLMAAQLGRLTELVEQRTAG